MPATHPRPILALSIRGLMMAVAVVACSVRWSTHWSDCKFQAALHATLAAGSRVRAADPSMVREARRAEWHREMSRRFEGAAWLPWPFPPAEPPRPE